MTQKQVELKTENERKEDKMLIKNGIRKENEQFAMIWLYQRWQ